MSLNPPSLRRVAPIQYFLKSGFVLLTLVAGLLAGPHNVMGQDKTAQRGFQPGNSFSVGDFETINTTSGNLMLHFPVGSLPPGRNGLTAGFNLIYNSKLLDRETAYFRDETHQCEGDGEGGPYVCPYYQKSLLKLSDEGGWRLSHEFRLKLIDRRAQYGNVPLDQQPQCLIYGGTVGPAYNEMTSRWKLMITFPDGSSHMLRPYGFSDSYGDDPQGDFYNVRPDGFLENCRYDDWYKVNGVRVPITYYSTDGSFLLLQVQVDNHGSWEDNPWTIYMTDGSRVTGGGGSPGTPPPPQRIYDRNNNYIEVTAF